MEIDSGDPVTVITVTYHLPRDQAEFWLFCNSEKMRSALWDISSRCRTAYKHGDNEDVASFAEEIRQMIYEEVDLDDCSWAGVPYLQRDKAVKWLFYTEGKAYVPLFEMQIQAKQT